MSDIFKSTVVEKGMTGQETVGTTPAQIDAPAKELFRGVAIKADPSNTDVVYIGFGDSVSATSGYPLAAGEEFPDFLPVFDVKKVWFVGGAVGQDFHWIAM